MSQMGRPPRRRPARSNIYTILIAVTLVALGIGIAFLWTANTTLTGESDPFYIVETR